jgi:toxin ParE1/3/4
LKIRWSDSSRLDLDRIYAFIAEDSPRSAADVEDRIFGAAEGLASFPNKGRPGRLDGTREMVVTPTPYLINYEVFDEHVSILRVVHGNQLWPPVEDAR